MRSFKRAVQTVCCTFALLANFSLSSSPSQSYSKAAPTTLPLNQLSLEVDLIGSIFAETYAPTQMKKALFNWDLQQELYKAKAKLLLHPEFSLKEKQQVIKRLLNSTCDYHVHAHFYSTEEAKLPFEVRCIDGAYYITSVDRELLPLAHYPIFPGDQVLTFAGEPIATVIEQLREERGRPYLAQNEPTEQAILCRKLTYRLGRRGDIVPKGSIALSLKRPNQAIYTCHLIWNHQPETVVPIAAKSEVLAKGIASVPNSGLPAEIIQLFAKKGNLPLLPKLKGFCEKMMAYGPFLDEPQGQEDIKSMGSWEMAAKKSFIPQLGSPIWQTPQDFPFWAYLYRSSENKLIGYVRIPSYIAGAVEAEAFEPLIDYFQSTTDGLIIDQVNNPGGSVFYSYTLLSMLTDKPLKTPLHRIMLSSEDLHLAATLLSIFNEIQTPFVAELLAGYLMDPYPVTYQNVLFLKEYCRFLIEQAQEGKKFTDPTYLLGVDQIQPHPRVRYTKPILFLINELGVSCGDCTPAILQDNQRATLMGQRTAGAGGCVGSVSYPNSLGIARFTYTYTLMQREANVFIENQGVSPDLPLLITPTDLQQNYRLYTQQIRQAIDTLLK